MAVRRPMLVVLVVIFASCPAFAQEDLFPPMVFYPKSDFSNDMTNEHMTTQLKALGEPSLWRTSQKDASARAYRFLWLASNEHPICVRVSKEGGAVSMRVTRHDGWPGVVAGKLNLDKTEKLSHEQWERLVEFVGKSKFWSAPAEVIESRGIADGDSMLIEGIEAGKYHVIDRAGSTTGEAYKNICRYLLELAKSEVIPAWDRWRGEERKALGYKAEPTETADSGVPDFLEEGFFPFLTFYPKNFERDREECDTKAGRLWELKQRSLWKLALRPDETDAFRLYWWTEDGDSVCVRVVNAAGMITLQLVQLDPDNDKVSVDVERKLTPEQWTSLVDQAEKSKFWSVPTEVRPQPELAKVEGVLIEGVQGAEFHVVERRGSTMTWPLRNLCRLMLELAGSNALPVWDRRREEERNDPNYQTEPPQVPDLDGVSIQPETPK